MPPARMTVSSDLRLRLSRAPMLPTMTANDSRISENAGSRSRPIHSRLGDRQVRGAARHAQELDHVDHEDQHRADAERAEDGEQEALGDVAAQCPSLQHRFSSW